MLSYKNWDPEAVRRLTGGVLASLALGWLVTAMLALWLGKLNKPDQQLITFLIGTASFQGMIFVLIGAFLREQGLSWCEAFGLDTPGLGQALTAALLTGVLVLAGALALGWLSAEALMRVGFQPEPQMTVQVLQATESTGRRILYGFIAIGVAPPAEELFFRGILYPTIKQLGLPRLAFWGTSILFGLVHLNLMALIPLTFVAVMLTLLYEKTNNLLAPMLAHSLFNMANFVVLVYGESLNRLLQSVHERI